MQVRLRIIFVRSRTPYIRMVCTRPASLYFSRLYGVALSATRVQDRNVSEIATQNLSRPLASR
jgi:hypothetical protein